MVRTGSECGRKPDVKAGPKGGKLEFGPLEFWLQEYLMGNPENLLKGKTAIEKLRITLKYIPMFSLTALFRVGTWVPKVGSRETIVISFCLPIVAVITSAAYASHAIAPCR